MNKQVNKKTSRGRIAVFLSLVLLLALTLVGCSGGAAKPKLTMASTISQIEGGNLNADQLKAVGALMVSVYDSTAFNTQDMLIAALRGYDMTAEGFSDANADPTVNGTADPAEAAKNVIRKANEKAKDAAKISEESFANLNALDVQRLVDIFKIDVDTEKQGGLWDGILRGVGSVLNWVTTYLGFGSYLVGICLFAVIVEIVMLPFAVKQQKNTIRQARLRPKEMAIRNKYKGRTDQVTMQKVQKEIQDLYQRENFNQFSGCLPLLLQFPILIALYNIVINPLHYVLGQTTAVSTALTSYYTAARAAGGMGQVLKSANSTIELLSGNGVQAFAGIQSFQYFNNSAAVWDSLDNITSVPNFNVFGMNFGLTPGFDSLNVLLLVPVLTFVVYYFSMRLNRKFSYQPAAQSGVDDRQVACSNTLMDVSMPAMSTVFAFMVPAIIGVYWIFRSILGVAKQFIMSRLMPLPKFTEEDYKAAAREMAGKAPKTVKKSERVGTVRSLHHIDDEDYEDTRERALAHKAAMEEHERREKEEKAKKSPFAAAELKEQREANAPASVEEQQNDDQNDQNNG